MIAIFDVSDYDLTLSFLTLVSYAGWYRVETPADIYFSVAVPYSIQNVNVMSLSNDPHLVVQFWALKSLVAIINAASMGYAPFVSSILGMQLKVYMPDSHEFGTLLNVNLSGTLSRCHNSPWARHTRIIQDQNP